MKENLTMENIFHEISMKRKVLLTNIGFEKKKNGNFDDNKNDFR